MPNVTARTIPEITRFASTIGDHQILWWGEIGSEFYDIYAHPMPAAQHDRDRLANMAIAALALSEHQEEVVGYGPRTTMNLLGNSVIAVRRYKFLDEKRVEKTQLCSRAWERKLRILSKLVPRNERVRIFDPLIEELHEDFLGQAKRCHTSNDHRLLKLVYGWRVFAVASRCITMAFGRWVTDLLPAAWRVAIVAAVVKAIGRITGG